jgi:hypothetical protein
LPGLFEKVRGATIASLALGRAGHFGMHIGQFQVIRRKLGKPIQF